MSSRSSASIRLWLVAALLGLSALMPAGAAPDRGDTVQANPTRAFAASTDAVRFGAEPFVAMHLRRVSHPRLVHALPRTSASASLFQAACVVPPSFAHSLAAHEHVTARTGAPLSTGPSRAPPVA